MAVRRRYYYWLVKAYIKKWRAVIFTSILAGIVGFFLFFGILQLYIQPLLSKQTQVIGYEGIVTPATIPEPILEDISFGLTKVDKNGKILPAASSSWEIRNNGKQYIFHLKKGLKFHNGDELTADNVPLEFKEAKVKKIDKYTVVYELDEVYAPFLSAVSKPLLLDNFEGLGEYKFSDVGINGGFIKELELVSVDDKRKKKKIFFYPSQDALKTAFVLGDVDKAIGVKDTIFNSSDLRNWKGVSLEKNTDYSSLLTLFYNTQDETLSDKKARLALQNGLPMIFEEGERTFGSIPEHSVYFSQTINYGIIDEELAKTYLDGSAIDEKTVLTLSTTKEYEKLAKTIQSSWLKVGIKSKIEIVNSIPDKFQIFLYPFTVKNDPDQYALWHSSQGSNISRYKNLRIDKLLEDGRSTVEPQKRYDIYTDFQKYLLDDAPATFLYYPTVYTLSR